MANHPYHYTESSLNNIYLINGYQFIETPRGESISINNIDGLHKAIGSFFVTGQRDLSGDEVRFLRHEMLMSQSTLAKLLGVSEQAIRRWENGKIKIPKPTESLLRLLYIDHFKDQNGKIAKMLKMIANLEEKFIDNPLLFEDTKKGWRSAA